jgi:hypothetical protein
MNVVVPNMICIERIYTIPCEPASRLRISDKGIGSVGTMIAGFGKRASKATVPPFPVRDGAFRNRLLKKLGSVSFGGMARVCFLRTNSWLL